MEKRIMFLEEISNLVAKSNESNSKIVARKIANLMIKRGRELLSTPYEGKLEEHELIKASALLNKSNLFPLVYQQAPELANIVGAVCCGETEAEHRQMWNQDSEHAQKMLNENGWLLLAITPDGERTIYYENFRRKKVVKKLNKVLNKLEKVNEEFFLDEDFGPEAELKWEICSVADCADFYRSYHFLDSNNNSIRVVGVRT